MCIVARPQLGNAKSSNSQTQIRTQYVVIIETRRDSEDEIAGVKSVVE